jgi:hypothetical protein
MTITSLNVAEQTIYDRSGHPGAYLSASRVIYLFDGSPVGYIDKQLIRTFRGMPVGWLIHGWSRSLQGRCVGYTKLAKTGLGPSILVLRPAPPKGTKKTIPGLGARKARPTIPASNAGWSQTPLQIFLSWVQYQAGE